MLVVNLYGAPSSGKSTVRADVFSRLKRMGVNCEEITEAAKRYTWQKRKLSLACQPYLFGKQLHETMVLNNQVEVVITDSPLILCCLYGRMSGVDYPESFYRSVVDISNQMNTLDVYLRRVHPYNPSGRNQTAEQADAVALELLNILNKEQIDYRILDGDDFAGQIIADAVVARLGEAK